MQKIGIGVAGVVGTWLGVAAIGSMGPAPNPIPTYERELTTQEVLEERVGRQAAALEAVSGEASSDGRPFDAREFRRQVEFDYVTLRSQAEISKRFIPNLERRTSPEKVDHFVQNGHPTFYQEIAAGVRAEDFVIRAIRSGNFEYGHFVRNNPTSRDLAPGVLVRGPEMKDGLVIRRTLFEAMLTHISSGGSLEPDLQPWSDVPLWNAGMDNLVFLNSREAYRTHRKLAEHLAGSSRELCAYINPPVPGAIDIRSLGQPGGITAWATGNVSEKDAPERIIEVINLDVVSNIREIVRHTPQDMIVPDQVRFPVVFSYDKRTGAVESIHPDPAYVRDPDVLYRCGTNFRDPVLRGESLGSLVRGLNVTSLPVAPAVGALPFRPEAGYMVFGQPLVSEGHDGIRGDYRFVSWEPIRIDFLAANGEGFNTGYLGSYGYREKRYYRLVREVGEDGQIVERKIQIGVDK